MKLNEPYRARQIRFLDLWTIGDFRIKAYTISYRNRALDPSLIAAARSTAQQRLEQSAPESNHYNVGFVGIHEGRDGNFVFVDWWADENELHHHVYVSAAATPAALEYRTPTGLSACAWDLRVICHERDQWVEAVLKGYPEPNINAYLDTRLETDA